MIDKTVIETDWGRRLTVTRYGDGSAHLKVEDTDDGGVMRAALAADEARTLGDALLGEKPTTKPKVFKENAALGDIRKGDFLRVEYTVNGVKHVREGVAYIVTEMGNWRTAENGWLNTVDARDHGGTITILDRPEPEPPVSPSLDRDGNAWCSDGEGVWWSITNSRKAPQTTEALIEFFGPLTPAKIVEADQ